MQATLGYLRQKGHDARVIVDSSPADSYKADRIDVITRPRRREKSPMLTSGQMSYLPKAKAR